MIGVTNMATKKLAASVVATTTGKLATYSPTSPVMVSIGRNAAIVVRVEVRMGIARSCAP